MAFVAGTTLVKAAEKFFRFREDVQPWRGMRRDWPSAPAASCVLRLRPGFSADIRFRIRRHGAAPSCTILAPDAPCARNAPSLRFPWLAKEECRCASAWPVAWARAGKQADRTFSRSGGAGKGRRRRRPHERGTQDSGSRGVPAGRRADGLGGEGPAPGPVLSAHGGAAFGISRSTRAGTRSSEGVVAAKDWGRNRHHPVWKAGPRPLKGVCRLRRPFSPAKEQSRERPSSYRCCPRSARHRPP